MDGVERRIASTGAQLEIVERMLDGWKPSSAEEKQCAEGFKTYVFVITLMVGN